MPRKRSEIQVEMALLFPCEPLPLCVSASRVPFSNNLFGGRAGGNCDDLGEAAVNCGMADCER